MVARARARWPLLTDRRALRREDVPREEEGLPLHVTRLLVSGARTEAAVEVVERVAVVRDLPASSRAPHDADQAGIDALPGQRLAGAREGRPNLRAVRVGFLAGRLAPGVVREHVEGPPGPIDHDRLLQLLVEGHLQD